MTRSSPGGRLDSVVQTLSGRFRAPNSASVGRSSAPDFAGGGSCERIRLAFALAGAVALAFAAPPARAAAFTVDTLDDEGVGATLPDDETDGEGLSLREAVYWANANGQDDTIVFSVTGTITLTSTLPTVTTNITILGPGATSLAISGDGKYRIFFQNGGALVIKGLTLTRGLAKGGDSIFGASPDGGGGGGAGGFGGAVLSYNGTLTLEDAAVSSCVARGGAGSTGSGGIDAGRGGGGIGGNSNQWVGGSGAPLGAPGQGGNGSGLTGENGGAFGGGGGGGGVYWLGYGGGAGGAGGYGAGGGGGGAYSVPISLNWGSYGGGPGGTFGGNGGWGVGNISSATGGGGGGGAGLGGAIYIRTGSLVLRNCDFSICSAIRGSPGGGANWGVYGQGKGGAIFVNSGVLVYHELISFHANSASNAGTSPTDNDDVYGADIQACRPCVISIEPAGPSPTGAASVDFTVTFSDDVYYVDVGDFALVRTATATGTVSTVAAENGSTYTVTVTGVSRDGTLRLDFADNGSVKDLTGEVLVGPALFVGGQYEIDTPPEVLSMAVSGTDTDIVYYEVVFDEDVTGVGVGDFAVATTPEAAASVTDVVQDSPSVYTVTVGLEPVGGGLPGYAVRLDLVDDDSIRDVHDNPLGGAGAGNGDFEGEVYIFESPPPYVLSSVPATPGPTNATSVVFTVTFSESVMGVTVDSADFKLVKTGTLACDPIGVPVTVGAVVTVTITNITGDGTLRLDVVDDGTIYDSLSGVVQLGGSGVGNGDFSDGDVCVFDNTAPYVARVTCDGPHPEVARSAVFTVTFSEDVKNVDATDFNVLKPATLSGAISDVIDEGGGVYTVIFKGVQGEGTLGLEVLVSDITDLATNPLAGPYTCSKTYDPPPYVSAVQNPVPDGANVSFDVVFTEPVWGALEVSNYFATLTYDVAYAGILVGGSDGDTTYTVTLMGLSDSGTVRLDVVDDDSIEDSAGNPLGGPGAGNGDFEDGAVYSYGSPPPHVVSVTRASPDPTKPFVLVSFAVKFDRTVASVDVSDFVLIATGTASGNVLTVSGSGDQRKVNIDTVMGEGTLGLKVLAAGISPALGRDYDSDQVYTVDSTPPVVSSVAAAGAPAGEGYALFTVTFSEDVTGVDVTDFVAKSGLAPVGTVSSVTQLSPSIYRVTVTGLTGTVTVRLDVIDDDSIRDLATNPLGGGLLGNGDFTAGQAHFVTPANERLGDDWWGGCAPVAASPSGRAGSAAGAAALALALAIVWVLLRPMRRRAM